jgi:hypothetical protein
MITFVNKRKRMKHRLLYLIFLCTFLLNFSFLQAQSQQTDVEQSNTSQRITVVVNDEHVMTVTNAPANSLLQIFSLVGTKVVEKRVIYNRQDFSLDLPVGYYIVRIGDETHKIIIR